MTTVSQVVSRCCPLCGQPIPQGETNCPYCTVPKLMLKLSREGVLVASFILLPIFFTLTGFITRSYHAKEQALAQEWFARGEEELKANRASIALEDFRTALFYSPDNDLFELRLAQALAAAGRSQEARAYLLHLWTREPGSGRVNLELARLAAQEWNIADTIRYYHNAIYGAWAEDPSGQQRSTRLELAQFLLGRGDSREAQAELMALAAAASPKDAALHIELGKLFLRAQDPNRALEEFRAALAVDRKQPDALAGAGQAAFLLGNYVQAEQYLDRAVQLDRKNTQASDMLATARQAVAINPFEMTLPDNERRQRVLRAFDAAEARLQTCASRRGEALSTSPPQTALQKLYAQPQAVRRDLNERNLRRHPELMRQTMEFVFQAEQLAANECGAPHGVDAALLLLAKNYRSAKQ
jgi:tetratricopeptide (TPR) repeat protein